jgi:hypothetical protein
VTDMTIERCTCCLLPVTDCKCFDWFFIVEIVQSQCTLRA